MQMTEILLVFIEFHRVTYLLGPLTNAFRSQYCLLGQCKFILLISQLFREDSILMEDEWEWGQILQHIDLTIISTLYCLL